MNLSNPNFVHLSWVYVKIPFFHRRGEPSAKAMNLSPYWAEYFASSPYTLTGKLPFAGWSRIQLATELQWRQYFLGHNEFKYIYIYINMYVCVYINHKSIIYGDLGWHIWTAKKTSKIYRIPRTYFSLTLRASQSQKLVPGSALYPITTPVVHVDHTWANPSPQWYRCMVQSRQGMPPKPDQLVGI